MNSVLKIPPFICKFLRAKCPIFEKVGFSFKAPEMFWELSIGIKVKR